MHKKIVPYAGPVTSCERLLLYQKRGESCKGRHIITTALHHKAQKHDRVLAERTLPAEFHGALEPAGSATWIVSFDTIIFNGDLGWQNKSFKTTKEIKIDDLIDWGLIDVVKTMC